MHRRLVAEHFPSSDKTGLRAYAATVGHLTGQRSTDVAMAVVCGIDHSNGYFFQTVVVQRSVPGPWQLIAALPPRDPGGTWDGKVERVKLIGHTLLVYERVHRPQDAHCCPSRIVTAEWHYQHGRFVPTLNTRRMHAERRPL